MANDRSKGEIEKRFNVIYFNKKILQDKEETKNNFSSFANLNGSLDFLKQNTKKFNSSTYIGLKNRLLNNKSKLNLYNEFYEKKKKERRELAIEMYNKWNYRANKMPRVRIRSKERILKSLKEKINTKSKKEKEGEENDGENNYKKQIDKNSRKYRISKINEVEFSWFNLENDGDSIIYSRDGATFTLDENPIETVGWLIGGFNENSLPQIWKYNLNYGTFQEVKVEGKFNSIPRFNHTAIIYNHKIYIFGGEIISKIDKFTRSTLNDIKILDTSINL